MRIALSELRSIINEELTLHQQQVIKNSMQSALRLAHKLVSALKFDEGDRSKVTEPLALVVRDARGWVPKMSRDYPHKAPAAHKFLELVQEIDKLAHTPFGGLFKSKNAEKAEKLLGELRALCENEFNVVHYDENYRKVDDRAYDAKRPTYDR